MKKLFIIFFYFLCFIASADTNQIVLRDTKHQHDHSEYIIATDVTAGHSVDSNRTPGDVAVKNGVEYEIEASGTVTLQGGFTVEKGATFAVYPSCF